MPCTHENFGANVEVNRIEDTGQFAADIQIKCSDCGVPFQFLGLPGGLSPNRPTVSVDSLEARLPIHPEGEPMPLKSYPGFTVVSRYSRL